MPELDKYERVRKLYPHFTQEGLEEADDNLREYITLALRIFERIEKDPVAYEEMCRRLGEQERARGLGRVADLGSSGGECS